MKNLNINIRPGSTKQRHAKLEEQPNKPFVNNQETASAYPPGTPSDEGFVSSPPIDINAPLSPSNKELIFRSKEYEKELPAILDIKIKEVREFFLLEALPLLMALNNGIDDASDIVSMALDERPESDSFAGLLHSLTSDALAVKTIKFVQRFANLDDAESILYTLKQLTARIGVSSQGQDLQEQILNLLQSGQRNNEPVPRRNRRRRESKE